MFDLQNYILSSVRQNISGRFVKNLYIRERALDELQVLES
jgi:hypothetical protein